MSLVVVGSFLMALNRFGGLAFEEPRSYLRLVLVLEWGWIALSIGVWATTNLVRRYTAAPPPAALGLERTLTIVGIAHIPVLTLSGVIFVSAGLLQLLGPGLVTAWFVFGLWFPLALTSGVRYTVRLSFPRAILAVVVPYAAWLWIFGSHILSQLAHLL
jgi:hypothetical protein